MTSRKEQQQRRPPLSDGFTLKKAMRRSALILLSASRRTSLGLAWRPAFANSTSFLGSVALKRSGLPCGRQTEGASPRAALQSPFRRDDRLVEYDVLDRFEVEVHLYSERLATDDHGPADGLSAAVLALARDRPFQPTCDLLADAKDLDGKLARWAKDETLDAEGARVATVEAVDERDEVGERLSGTGARHADDVSGWLSHDSRDGLSLNGRGSGEAADEKRAEQGGMEALLESAFFATSTPALTLACCMTEAMNWASSRSSSSSCCILWSTARDGRALTGRDEDEAADAGSVLDTSELVISKPSSSSLSSLLALVRLDDGLAVLEEGVVRARFCLDGAGAKATSSFAV
ncbi:hypothetical protein L1887_54944 [Cichorium endivia]|nr:hypothetical protein L1887_54944 [Cichorium endivia]